MIAVIFEVWPDRRDDYLDIAAELRPHALHDRKQVVHAERDRICRIGERMHGHGI